MVQSGSLAGAGLFAAVVLAASAVGGAGVDATTANAREILGRAFRNAHEVDTLQSIEFVIHPARGDDALRREVTLANKRIDGKVHTLAVFTSPPHLRDTKFLSVDRRDRSDDQFVYLPALERVRRITGANGSEPFFGTDLAYEDLQARIVDDYDDVAFRPSQKQEAGEPIWVVSAKPDYTSGYDRIDFRIAREDAAILGTQHYRQGRLVKSIRIPRSGMQERKGHVLPTRMHVKDRKKGSRTEAIVHSLEVNPAIDDRTFSAVTLQQRTSLPKTRR